MASPTDVSYVRNDGANVIYAGLLEAPTWRLNQTSMTWISLTPTNTIQSLDPEQNPALNPNFPAVADYRANQGINAEFRSWNGGFWVDELARFFSGPQGGHNDYWGNEMYEWDAFTTDWTLTSPPTPTSALLGDLTVIDMLYADNRVRSCHTYSLFAVRNGVLWFFGGAIARPNGSFFSQPFYWNDTIKEWVRDSNVNLHSNTSTGCRGVIYNPDTDKFWILQGANQAPRIYDPVLKTVSLGTRFLNMSDDKQGFYLGDPNMFLVFGRQSSVNRVRVLTEDSDATDIITTGTAPVVSDYGSMGICYDSIRNRYLIYNGGASIHTLTPPANSDFVNGTWEWGTLTIDGSNVVIPTAAQANGTFQRFWFSERFNCCGVINEIDEAMYVFALEDL